MPKPLIDDELWNIIEPISPKRRRRKKNLDRLLGESDCAALTGIVILLRSGVPWKMLPREAGCGGGATCW